MAPLLEVEHLSLSFTQYDRRIRRELTPVRDLSLRVSAGQVVAVIGASGSGKSLLAHCLLGVLPDNARYTGTITYDGAPLTPERIRALRGKEIALVPQGVTYLDPLMKVGNTLTGGKKDRAARRDAVLQRYGLGASAADLYPFELSGGMVRRVLIGTAVMETPRLLIADEPTPGLDDGTARRVLGHLKELADDGCGVLLITHDVALALTVADRICVLCDGHTVEELSAAAFVAGKHYHPYTHALWDALPENGFSVLPEPDRAVESACCFAPRCPYGDEACRGEIALRPCGDGRVRCVKGGDA